MPNFLPFRGLRPNKETAQDFVTKNVDHYSKEQIQEYIKTRPHSFLHIIQPTWDDSIDHETRYKKVRENLEQDLSNKVIARDKSSIYIYQLIKPNGITTKGLLGLVNIKDYRNNKIKKHEQTLQDRVDMFTDYLLNTHFHAEPVLLTYKPTQRIDLLVDNEIKKTPTLKIQEENGALHMLWKVDKRLILSQIKESISNLESLYIADGHHRMESSEKYTKSIETQVGDEAMGNESFHYTLAMLVSNNDLIIKDYNRMITDLNGYSNEEFFNKLEENFDVIERDEQPIYPNKKHHIVMYLDGKFYNLYVKNNALTEEGLRELDTYIFEQTILQPIFNITDSRNDKRILYQRGTGDIRGVELLKNKVDQGKAKVAFSFYPVSVNDLQLIADMNLTMPPKSTYIEPKPLSGFAIFDLKD
ncbi:DUF1015 domain-containing protein [Vaginella massiliensis]|uniref:DUF1015 domain-containing protein n=1 Tax=Vaginella massiliensis TaxID=1816680 RepID=UPI000838F184|nr:DUF1015 domain-containing protein [Vaginella massiliensis]